MELWREVWKGVAVGFQTPNVLRVLERLVQVIDWLIIQKLSEQLNIDKISKKECKYAGMQVCRYAGMQACKYVSMQVCKYASI